MSKSKVKSSSNIMKRAVEREESASSDSKEEQQTTSDHSTSGTEWLRSELQLMMYGLGDCRRPLQQSVSLVETILKQQMILLVDLVFEVWTSNGAKGPIRPRHLLFLIRHDKAKLFRLLRHMCLRDARGKLLAASGGGDSTGAGDIVGNGEDEIYPEAETEHDEDFDEEPLDDGQHENEMGELDGNGSKHRKKQNSAKNGIRRRICVKFLTEIDQTGELISLLDGRDDADDEDEVKAERQMRLEKATRFMEAERYVEFSQARTASFCRKNRVNKFRDWMQSLFQSHIKVTDIAMEIFSYFAYETVAQLVDLSIIVKRENKSNVYFPHQHASVMDNAESLKNTKRQKLDEGIWELCSHSAIQPSEIREAMRRFNRPNGAMSSFAKSYTMPIRGKLLCL